MSEARPSPTKPQRVETTGIRLLEADREHAACTWRNLFVVYWLGETTPGAVARLHQPLLRLGQQHPEKLGLIQVVGASTAAPPSEARDALAKFLKAGGEVIACSALVVPGVGFRMAAARALATGLVMLARPPFQHQVYATVDQAASWLSSVVPSLEGPPMQAREIVAVVTNLQNRVQDRRPPVVPT